MRSSILFTLLAFGPATAMAPAGQARIGIAAPPIVTPYRPSGLYELGDLVGWRIGRSLEGPAAYRYTLKANNSVVLQEGELDLTGGTRTVEIRGQKPAMLLLELKPSSGPSLTYGAALDPHGLKPVEPRPRDFDAFWLRQMEALRRIPAKPVLSPVPSNREGIDYATIRMTHINGTGVYGTLARPSKPGKFPAVLVLQWASPPYPLQPAWVQDRAAEGWLALNIEPHDVLPTEPPSYYAGLPDRIKNYNVIGMDDRESNYFVEMYLRGVRAVDFLTQHPNWDGKTIVVTGGSMGGQQALAVAGLHSKVTHAIAEEPAGCDQAGSLHGRQMGYPFLPVDNPKVRETVRYIDIVNFAPRIRATTLVGIGFVDTVTPPAGIWTAFNLIPGPKRAIPLPTAPHNNLATGEQMRPYREVASAWFRALAEGRPVELTPRTR
jgi:cephalosporin-C deacetylase-like acetyl esterase